MPPPKINPLRHNRREISAPTAIRRPNSTARPKRACPNKQCATPNIVDGVCHSCGTIVDDSNIVAEVQFGENSTGAAVVQGSYVGADQGGVRTMGPAFKRMGGDEGGGRDGTIRDGKRVMTSMANQLGGISENIISQGVQIFKIAAMNNFIQGRRIDMVAAVCLYSACRKEQPCRVMLIDFADRCQVNVFKLGKTFKDLHDAITISKDGIRPVLPEDLIYRFASKLEFGPMLDKVADDACRMVKRMSFDWMVMGRRPSGVCGACLILAARMNNFRRTITEVVYVVKVTTHTIKKRLDEFKRTATSTLTIEEFLNEEWRNSVAHDPPSFYEKTEEFQKTMKKRKKRKPFTLEGEEGHEQPEEVSSNKRQRIEKQKEINDTTVEIRRDAEGFAIPPRPVQVIDDIPIDPLLLGETTDSDQRNRLQLEVGKETLENFDDLMDAFGDKPAQEDSSEDPEEDSEATSRDGSEGAAGEKSDTASSRRGKKGPDNRPILVSDEWSQDEADLAAVISEIIENPGMAEAAASMTENSPVHKVIANLEPSSSSDSVLEVVNKAPETIPNVVGPVPESTFDPHSDAYAARFEQATIRADAHMRAAQDQAPSKAVCMDVHIGVDEFADDPEVMNCLLDADASARKEKIWVNNNREWLRKQQLREYQRQMAENGPPKATRNRKKKPRIGEGQTSAASSPAEAAVEVMKQRSFSKKINYDAISAMFGQTQAGRNGLGSAATSRMTSRAGSALGSRASSILSDNGSEVSSVSSSILKDNRPRQRKSPTKAPPTPVEIDDEPDSEDDDYINPNASKGATSTAKPVEEEEEEAQEEGWRAGFNKPANDDEDEALDDDRDYGYENGDLDDDAAFDNASIGGASNKDYDENGY